MKERVVVDTDFCKMITEKEGKPSDSKLFKAIFETLDLQPVFHEFIYKNEVFDNPIIIELVENGFIEVIKYDDFIPENWMKEQYKDTFCDFYKFMNGVSFPDKADVFSFRKAHSNLGEIHSLILAHFMNIPIFMSNDNGAKSLAEQKINTSSYSIDVESLCDVFCKIKQSGKSDYLDKQTVRALLKSRKGWTEAYNAVVSNPN